MQISGLSVTWAQVTPWSSEAVAVDLDGVGGGDFVACCDESLLREIVLAAGEEFCAEVLAGKAETLK
jgi:hypothetical protein